MQLQQACLLAELLLAVLLQHFAETNGDPTALSRLGDNRVSSFRHCNGRLKITDARTTSAFPATILDEGANMIGAAGVMF